MKAITTKYIGPTNSRGSRIKAITDDGKNGTSITIPYDYSLNSQDNHAQAALALARKLEWTGELISGATKDGYVFVFANSDKYEI